jgi:hypothetical protein
VILKRHRGDIAASAALVVLDLLLYRKVLRLWWTYDDANILHTIVDDRVADYFLNRAVWPQQLFTPLLMVVFKLQMSLFGLETVRWYTLHLSIACLTTLAVYGACRLFLDVGPALTASALFTLGAPLCSVVTQLSTVHYFVAIIFGALATIAYVIALRKGSAPVAIASASLYLAAMLAKEIAVPLPLFFLSLPLRDLRSRLRYAIGHGAALLIYLTWRRAVIGTFFGAYSWVIDRGEWPGLLLSLPWRVIRAAGGAGLPLGLVLIVIMGACMVAAIRRKSVILVLIMAGVVATAPLLPLAKEVNRRYVVVPWLAWSVAFAAAVSTLRDRQHTTVFLIVAPLIAVVVNRQEWSDVFRVRQRMSQEGRFFLDMPSDGLLRMPITPSSTMRELNWLKTVYLGKSGGAISFYDDFFLCVHGLGGKRVWQYDDNARGVVEITPRAVQISRRHCATVRAVAPLSARFHFDKPALYWDLGPYTDGRYTVLLGDGIEAFQVPRHDALNVPGATGFDLRIRYDSPQGWTTYSPDLPLDFVRRSDFAWRR